MRANVILYRDRIRSKTEQMNRNLRDLDISTVIQLQHLQEVTSSATKAILMGKAWDTVLRYVEVVQVPLMNTYRLWIREQMNANDRYGAAADLLTQPILNRWQLERELDYWEDELSDEQSDDEPSYSAIRFYRRMIRETEAKLRSMDQFLSRTSGIYGRAEQVLVTLSQADEQLKKVSFDAGNNRIHLGDLSNQWLLELDTASAMQYLLANGVTRIEIQNLDDMGFAPGEIKTIWESIKTEDDKALLHGLMKGDYDAAFQANAAGISTETQMFLSEYMLRLATADNASGLKEFETAMNALLQPRRDESYYGVAGFIGSNSNAKKYLETLYAGTTNMLDMESLMLYAPEILGEGQYEALIKRNEHLIGLATLYGSQYEVVQGVLFDNLGGNSIKDLSNLSISGLQYSEANNAYEYVLEYAGLERFFGLAGETGVEEIAGKMTISTAILETPGQVSKQIVQEARMELEKVREELGGKLMTDLAAGGGVVYLTALHPILGAGAAVIYGIADGNYKSAYDSGVKGVKASTFMSHDLVNGVFSNANIAIPGVVLKAAQGYLKNSQRLDKEDAWLENLSRMSWFGSGGMYRVDGEDGRMVVSGIYNPAVIEKLRIWSEEGLEQLLLRERGYLKDELENRKAEFKREFLDQEGQIWYGEDILNMDINELSEAILKLEEKYKGIMNEPLDMEALLNPEGERGSSSK